MFSGTVLAAFLARTAALTQLAATGHGSRQAEELHALLERRAFLAMLTARLMPGGPRHGPSRRRRRCSHRGTCVRRGDGARRLVRTTPYAVLRQGIGSGRSPRS